MLLQRLYDLAAYVLIMQKMLAQRLLISKHWAKILSEPGLLGFRGFLGKGFKRLFAG
jgi:hypothetical protein